MWVACLNYERCGGGVDVELEPVTGGEEPYQSFGIAAVISGDDGTRCDAGCELTEPQIDLLCQQAAQDYLLGIGDEW